MPQQAKLQGGHIAPICIVLTRDCKSRISSGTPFLRGFASYSGKVLSEDHDHMCSKSFLRESWSWSSSSSLPRADVQRTMTICAASLAGGNLGHGHRLFLSHILQQRGFWNQFPTPSPKVLEPHFLRFGLPEPLLNPDEWEGFFTTKITIKIKHLRREELIRMENTHMFLATIADGKTAASWGEGQKNSKKTHPDTANSGPQGSNRRCPWTIYIAIC